ncbi:hypothetical protein [Enterocloster asparagiformis]|uniref:hypothetical protein n=1 Tax=Enterocloster asparagiformis TaxID=333367 RepID=UPI002A7F628E|nr:hypothetical protein [Enterocloster asparagiformis]
MIRGAKTIAEYAIRSWLETENFEMSCFELTMNGNEGLLTDRTGATLRLVYDNRSKTVSVAE